MHYRDALKGGPVLLSNSQAGPGRNFSQPRDHLLVNPCRFAQFEHCLTQSAVAVESEMIMLHSIGLPLLSVPCMEVPLLDPGWRPHVQFIWNMINAHWESRIRSMTTAPEEKISHLGIRRGTNLLLSSPRTVTWNNPWIMCAWNRCPTRAAAPNTNCPFLLPSSAQGGDRV